MELGYDGRLYILGAYGDNAPGGLAGWFNEYDPAADRWTKKRDIPMPVHHQAMVGYNGKVYVFGGGIKPTPTGGNWFPTNRTWEYTPETDSWREIRSMPTRRGGGFATEMSGKIHVIGGAGYHPGQTEEVSMSATVPHRSLATHEVYDPKTDRNIALEVSRAISFVRDDFPVLRNGDRESRLVRLGPTEDLVQIGSFVLRESRGCDKQGGNH